MMSDAPRTNYFRGQTLNRLQANTDLTDLLETAASVDDGASAIVPAPYLEKLHDDPNEDPPDVAVAVSVVVSSSSRRNNQEDVNVELQTDLQVRKQTLWSLGLAWIDKIRDAVSQEMTRHGAGWHAGGEVGGTPEPLWNDDINRYHVVQRFDVSSSDARELAGRTKTLTIDDFEDGDISEYDDPDNILSAQQSVVYEGSWAGEIDNQSGALATAISQSGLDNYPSRGDKFRVYMRVDNITISMAFGVESATKGYSLALKSSGDVYLSSRSSDGSTTVLDGASFSYGGGFVPMVVDFDSTGDGTISVDAANGAATLSAQDNEHDGTGVGWGAADGAVGYVDSAEIIE